MDEKEFYKLIKKDRYQVFLFTSPLPIPLNFVSHSWFITSNKGKINRWEVWQFKNIIKNSKGHLYKNLFKPWEGLAKLPFPFKIKSRFNSKLINSLEGKNGSSAEKMVNFIEKQAYGYKDSYNYRYIPGPNSNTFTQWIIDKFPKSKFKLPSNALGKNYQY